MGLYLLSILIERHSRVLSAFVIDGVVIVVVFAGELLC